MGQTVKTRILIRNDTADNWADANPVLSRGEMGVEIDTRKFKFGDNTTAWNNLEYASCSGGKVINVENNDGQYASDSAALASITEDIEPGDIAVVKTYSNSKLINTSSYQYSPVGNSLEWVAIDGNVDASKVILNKDITLAGNYTSVGNINKGNAAAVNYEAKGKSVQDLLVEMLSKRQQPSKTEPSHTLTLTNAGATMASEYESGTTIHPRYSISFNAGSYSYDSSTGVTAQSYSVTDNQSNSGTAQNGNLGEGVVLNDGVTYQITSSSVNYSAGTVAHDNLGDVSSPAIQIAAGTTASKSSITVTSYRNMYVGYSSKTTGFTSADIKGLTSIQAVKNAARTFNTLAENTSAASIVIAAPTGTRTLNKVVMPSSANADCTASFVKQSTTVDVLNAASQTAKYDIWVYAPAKMGGTYSITMG